ncbi:MAG: protein-disulfide reductase DsbD family protein [Burkholderiaceae bacterium]
MTLFRRTVRFAARRSAWLAFWALTLGLVAGAHAASLRVDAVEAELIADVAAVVPGQPFKLGLRLAHDPHWHTYWRNPGDSGLPTQFDAVAPAGSSVGEIEWPAPQRVFIPPLANYGFEGEIVLPRRVTLPADYAGDRVTFEAKAAWLVCRDVCVPGEADLSLTLPVGRAEAGKGPHRALFDAAARRTPGPAVAVPVFARKGLMSIILPKDSLDDGGVRAEFFGLREGAIQYAAPQQVYRLDDGRIRVEVALAKGVADASAALAADGVVVAGARVLAVTGAPAGAPVVGEHAPAGTLIAKIDGAPSAPMSPGDRLSSSPRTSRLPALPGLSRRDASDRGAMAVAVPGPRDSATPATEPAAPPVVVGPGGLFGAATGSVRSLLPALLFAFVGGAILNLMPCVFPVIGLKILSFAGHGAAGSEALSDAARARLRHGAAWFALGVVLSFWLLAGLMLALRAAGEAAGWGFQLQSPGFVTAMALLFVFIGLNFSGVFEFGSSVTRIASVEASAARAGGRGRPWARWGRGRSPSWWRHLALHPSWVPRSGSPSRRRPSRRCSFSRRSDWAWRPHTCFWACSPAGCVGCRAPGAGWSPCAKRWRFRCILPPLGWPGCSDSKPESMRCSHWRPGPF